MIYVWKCEQNHRFDRYSTVDARNDPQRCECGAMAQRIITPPTIFGSRDIHYTSPIDGRVIDSMAARREDLARNGCREYDPEMKTDYHRRQKDSDAALEKAIDATVDREIATMPARNREKLEAEMQGGVGAEPVRITAPMKPITTRIAHG